MPKEFTIALDGHLDVMRRLQALGDGALRASAEALYQEGTDLLNDSKRLCPVDTGTLIGSGFVQPPDLSGHVAEVVVGYGGAAAPYALAVHENPRSGKTGGVSPSGQKYKTWATVGQWKYLEEPFKTRMTGFYDRIGAILDRILLRE